MSELIVFKELGKFILYARYKEYRKGDTKKRIATVSQKHRTLPILKENV